MNDLGQFAREWLQKFVPQIDDRLREIWDGESQNYFGYNLRQKAIAEEMVLHAKAHNLAPSKRIRSAFVYNGYKLGKPKIEEEVWRAAAGIELVHSALLMHDDFMDEDLARRGAETTNAYYSKKFGRHYGDAMAVNTGDMVLNLGFETVTGCGLDDKRVLAALRHLFRTIQNTAYGQAHDVTLGHLVDWMEEDVLAVHQAKTGFYTYENPLLVGAILAGLDNKVIEILKAYAKDGGVAFQLQDDILGVFGEPEKTGKSADSDLLQGKATLLVLKVLDRPEIRRVWGKKQASQTDLQAAKQAIIDSGSLEYSKQLARELAQRAAKTAEKLRDFDVDMEAVDFIQGVAEYMVDREI